MEIKKIKKKNKISKDKIKDKNKNEVDQKDENNNSKIFEDNNDNELNTEENNKNNLEKEEMDYIYCDIDGEIRMLLPTSHYSVNNIFDVLIKFTENNIKVDGFLVC